MEHNRVIIVGTIPYNKNTSSRAFDAYFHNWEKKNMRQIFSNTKTPVQKAKSKFSIMSIINWLVHLPGLRIIKDKLKPNERYYKVYEEEFGKYIFIQNYDNKLFNIDGHPSFTDDGRYMITDSYPDSDGNQRLMVFDSQTLKGIIIAKLAAPLSGNPASCDLHPKLSYGAKYVAVDTAYLGKHHMARSIALLGMCVINVAASIILIKMIGFIGAAIGTAISVIVGHGIIINLYLHRCIGLNVPRMFKEIFKGLLPAFLLCLAIGYLISLIPGSNIVFFGIKVVLLVIEYGMIMYMFGMNEIEKQYIKNMIKR